MSPALASPFPAPALIGTGCYWQPSSRLRLPRCSRIGTTVCCYEFGGRILGFDGASNPFSFGNRICLLLEQYSGAKGW